MENNMNAMTRTLTAILAFFALSTLQLQAADLIDSDGKPADTSKPVKVFILMGQSNMLGFGKVSGGKEGQLDYAVKNKGLYPFLMDEDGKWIKRNDVRNVFTMGSGGPDSKGRIRKNEFMTINGGKIGPEIGIGHHLGNLFDEPVLILKSCIGNRSLGWDLLPPGSPSYEFQGLDKKTNQKKTYIYAGYGQSPDFWEKGTKPNAIGWKAGLQYDGDVARSKDILKNIGKYYPGTKSYEVAGFFWWQGDKDRYKAAHAARYEQNLVNLFRSLRKEFNAPKAKMVVATLGQTNKDTATGNEKLIIDAMFAFAGKPEFKGDAATVYSHPLSMGGASNSHYDGHSETYMNVGLGMGKAMVKLFE